MVEIIQMIEIILYVQNMHAQVHFYRDVLELELSHPKNLQDYSNQMWVTFETGTCMLALHGGGRGELGTDAPKFVFEVEDVEKTRQALSSRGVLMGQVRTAAPGVLVWDGRDPEGNKFSIESRSLL